MKRILLLLALLALSLCIAPQEEQKPMQALMELKEKYEKAKAHGIIELDVKSQNLRARWEFWVGEIKAIDMHAARILATEDQNMLCFPIVFGFEECVPLEDFRFLFDEIYKKLEASEELRLEGSCFLTADMNACFNEQGIPIEVREGEDRMSVKIIDDSSFEFEPGTIIVSTKVHHFHVLVDPTLSVLEIPELPAQRVKLCKAEMCVQGEPIDEGFIFFDLALCQQGKREKIRMVIESVVTEEAKLEIICPEEKVPVFEGFEPFIYYGPFALAFQYPQDFEIVQEPQLPMPEEFELISIFRSPPTSENDDFQETIVVGLLYVPDLEQAIDLELSTLTMLGDFNIISVEEFQFGQLDAREVLLQSGPLKVNLVLILTDSGVLELSYTGTTDFDLFLEDFEKLLETLVVESAPTLPEVEIPEI